MMTGYVFFYLVAEFRHVEPDSWDQQACSASTLESLHYLCIWSVISLVCCTGDFETEQVLLEYRGEFFFCSYLGFPAMYFFNTS